MSVTTTGVEFKRYYADKLFWPEGQYHEDEVIRVDGKLADGDTDLGEVEDGAVLTIEGGIVLFEDNDKGSVESHFKKWKKKQTTTSIVAECDISKREAVVAAVKAAGGKVL